MKHVFIIGSRGLPAVYGGFETFVEALVSYQKSTDIQYHVACLSQTPREPFEYKGARCFPVVVPKLGPASVIAYDMLALRQSFAYVKEHQIKAPIFYILGNTIGGCISPFAHKIHRLGGKLWINPDGLEWKRSKWSRPVQRYLRYAEKMMAIRSDLVISDNRGIERYMTAHYPMAKTSFIAYGTQKSTPLSETRQADFARLLSSWQVSAKGYYLMVSRFVPENNYEIMIREFMKSDTQKDLIIICNHEGNTFYDRLQETTHFSSDSRIKFVGTLYDHELLAEVRRQAYAYLHGHEVGGTNPGLLEALSTTDLNLVLDVSFNREVALDTALYWSKDSGSLCQLINQVDKTSSYQDLGEKAKAHMQENYSWSKIIGEYEGLIQNEG